MKFLAMLVVALVLWAAPVCAQKFQADSNVSVSSNLIANNTTAIVVTAAFANLYAVEASNNGATIAYVKLYNAASGTCGSGTPRARYMIPASTSMQWPVVNGDAYPTGIVLCVTTGIADNDTSAPAASAYIVNVHYK